MCCALAVGNARAAASADTYLASCRLAPQLADDVQHHVLPFWLHTVDEQHGGYIVERAVDANARGATRQLVTHARLLWGFARAHRAGIDGPDDRYLRAADTGYRFLADHFLDAAHGGYYWMTDRAGHPVDRRKVLYGQAFVMYALAEYYRASGNAAALDDAHRLFAALERHARDRVHGGWIEHFEADWRPILAPQRYLLVEVAGLKSANTHLHLMEALTDLAELTPSPQVTGALRDVLAINARVFFSSPAHPVSHVSRDWSAPPRAWRPRAVAEAVRRLAFGGARISYGHNVEFAWMARRAESALGMTADWAAFDAFLGHALAYGFDHARGGLYDAGFGSSTAWFTDKLWWPQAELLMALTMADERRPSRSYTRALGRQIEWIVGVQADPQTRVWRSALSANGDDADPRLAYDWKTTYHDLRASLTYLGHCGRIRLSMLQASR